MDILTHNYRNINNIQFKANNVPEKKERAPFFSETMEIVDRVYDNYRKSLKEVSFNEVRTTAMEVAQETQTPKKDVLKAMQLLTQFSNMTDLKVISKAINKENIEFLGNEKGELCFNAIDKGFAVRNVANISKETGIHSSLMYLLERKKLAPFEFSDNGKIGIILDEEKISQLEKAKEQQPNEFESFAKDKNLKFFYISGWDNGISVADRTKNLKEETKSLLNTAKKQNISIEEAIDYPYIDKIKNLGITPVIIRNENEATEFTIYNQMRPEKMCTKNSLYNVIEANTLDRFYGCSDTKKAVSNHISATYLDETLSVYTFEQMSQDLKNLHEKINQYAEAKGKEPLYIIPNRDIKSSDFINYSYKKINNIDSKKFVYMGQLSNYFKYNEERSDKTLMVIIDDCALSGNSMRDIMNLGNNFVNVSNKVPLLFANLKCSDEALRNFENNFLRPVDIIYMDKIKSHYINNDQLEYIIGKPQYREQAYSLTFPYMAPDNNSELATNIALLHNSKFNSANFSSDMHRHSYKKDDLDNLSERDKKLYLKKHADRMEYSYCTKNITDDVLETSTIYAQTIGMNPVKFVDNSRDTITPKELNSITDDIYKKIIYID